MKNLNFYIAYLLTKHECVIIPGLGAFIASALEADVIKQAGLLCPPAQTLGFNAEIKHNDGLLTNAVAKGEKIPYKEACLQIARQVDLLNNQLFAQKSVLIPWIGQLSLLPEHKIVFTPSINLSCNATHFGLNNFYLPTLQELNEAVEILPVSSRKETVNVPIIRKAIRWYGSVAAAALALFLISMPLNEHMKSNPQQAGFVHWSTLPVKTDVVEEISTEIDSTILMKEVVEGAVVEEPVVDITFYYIVIASLPTRDLAEQQVGVFHREGFSMAAVVSNQDRHRIYVNKFVNKSEAETFLREFRYQYPRHGDAWLLSQAGVS